MIEHSRFDTLPERRRDASADGGDVGFGPGCVTRARTHTDRFTLIVVGDGVGQDPGQSRPHLCMSGSSSGQSATPKAMRLFITDVVLGFNSRLDRFQAIYKLQGDMRTVCRDRWISTSPRGILQQRRNILRL